jgi:REP element-mobilizing transposase RayT
MTDKAMKNLVDAGKATATRSGKSGDGKGYHLFTLVTNGRARVFASRELARIATEVILFHERKKDLRLRGFIVMPDHIHIICEPVKALHNVIRDIKKLISLMSIGHLAVAGGNALKSIESQGQDGKRPLFQLWRRAYHHARILTEERLTEALQYLYEHPVRSGMCETAFEYEFSDVHRHLGSGFRTRRDWPCLFPVKKLNASASHAGKMARGRPGSSPVS